MTVSVAEAVELLGITRPDAARWLRRYLRRRGDAIGVTLLIDVGAGARATYHVPFPRLRSHCPELFDPEVRFAQAARLDARLTRESIHGVEEAITDLRADVHILTEAVRLLR